MARHASRPMAAGGPPQMSSMDRKYTKAGRHRIKGFLFAAGA
jgi:hypothetical protein